MPYTPEEAYAQLSKVFKQYIDHSNDKLKKCYFEADTDNGAVKSNRPQSGTVDHKEWLLSTYSSLTSNAFKIYNELGISTSWLAAELDSKMTINEILKATLSFQNKVLKKIADHYKQKLPTELDIGEWKFEDGIAYHITLKDTQLLADAVESYFRSDTKEDMKLASITDFIKRTRLSYPILERTIKGIAVQQLQGYLHSPTDKDEPNKVKNINSTCDALNNSNMQEILATDLQSKTEYGLKLLSVIFIGFGIGIIPTALLMAKRLYDTDGQSANFFKPLSKNLSENAANVTSHTLGL